MSVITHLPQEKIRNFSIIAHIDHGKTTLTDRFLQLTHSIEARVWRERMMDSNPIEQERGITIKLAPVRMVFNSSFQDQKSDFVLNLIDTPGHVDFGYEVSRSLAACEGVLLVIDATQGVQAQTLANYEKAKALGLTILPVLNKIDLASADVDQVKLECMETFKMKEEDILLVSAKTGLYAEEVLHSIIQKVPAPQGDQNKPLRALIFTSVFNQHKGVIAYVRVVDGVLKKQSLALYSNKEQLLPVEIGVFSPQMTPVDALYPGEVGYVSTGLKDVSLIRVGDTLTETSKVEQIQPLPGYQEPIPVVYMQFYPVDGDDFMLLQDAVAKLSLHDSSLTSIGVHSPALGNGLRIGFLGLLHSEIVLERLEREFDLDLIVTSPTVSYKVEQKNGEIVDIKSPVDLPDPSLISRVLEPVAQTSIFSPEKYVGPIMKLCREHRGELLEVENRGVRTKMIYQMPLSEIIISFHDQLKSITSGFASMEYEINGYEEVKAVKLDIVVQGETIEALSQIVVETQAEQIGRKVVEKLKEVLPRQMFEVPIQAAIGGKIVARETIRAYRKDVTAKLYGGDVTRRMKLLRKQAKGKKKMKQIGKVELNQEAFLAVLAR